MDNAEASAENGPQHDNLENFYVDLNNRKLLQILREFKDELQTLKQDNQIFLELNEYLLDKMNNQGKDRRGAIETDFETTSYKHNGNRLKYPNIESSSEVKPR